MNKFIIFLVLVAVVIAGWFALSGPSNDYEVVVVDEVTQLETELAALDAAVANGTLTAAQATEARIRISDSLDRITANASGASDASLTPAQRAQLQDGLARLKDVLIKYQSTLVAIDKESLKDTKSNHGTRTLSSQFLSAVTSVEGVVQDVVDEYQSDESTDDAIDAIDDTDSESMDELNEEVEEETSTSTTESEDEEVPTETEAETSTEADVATEDAE